jgi:hypothetical protein
MKTYMHFCANLEPRSLNITEVTNILNKNCNENVKEFIFNTLLWKLTASVV